jgi:hypothetical protein
VRMLAEGETIDAACFSSERCPLSLGTFDVRRWDFLTPPYRTCRWSPRLKAWPLWIGIRGLGRTHHPSLNCRRSPCAGFLSGPKGRGIGLHAPGRRIRYRVGLGPLARRRDIHCGFQVIASELQGLPEQARPNGSSPAQVSRAASPTSAARTGPPARMR